MLRFTAIVVALCSCSLQSQGTGTGQSQGAPAQEAATCLHRHPAQNSARHLQGNQAPHERDADDHRKTARARGQHRR